MWCCTYQKFVFNLFSLFTIEKMERYWGFLFVYFVKTENCSEVQKDQNASEVIPLILMRSFGRKLPLLVILPKWCIPLSIPNFIERNLFLIDVTFFQYPSKYQSLDRACKILSTILTFRIRNLVVTCNFIDIGETIIALKQSAQRTCRAQSEMTQHTVKCHFRMEKEKDTVVIDMAVGLSDNNLYRHKTCQFHFHMGLVPVSNKTSTEL